MSNKQFISNLSSAYADVRKLDVKKINLKGKNIIEYINGNKTNVLDERGTKADDTLDIWNSYVTKDENYNVIINRNAKPFKHGVKYNGWESTYEGVTQSQIETLNTAVKVIDNEVLGANDEHIMYWQTDGLTDGYSIFNNCSNLTSFSSDLSSLTDGENMFYQCPNLTSFSSDLSNLTTGFSMFGECSSLTTFTSDLSSLTVAYNMFGECSNLTTFTSDLSSLTDGRSMFENCPLTTFTSDLSSLTDGRSMFENCPLTTFTSDLSSLTDGRSMFENCTALASFSSDLSSLTTGYDMFSGCKLDAQSVANIIHFIPQRDAKPTSTESSGSGDIHIGASDLGKILIGISIANTDEAKQAFAEECYCDGWVELNKEFDDKNWTVQWQFNGESTTFDLRGERPSTSVYARLEEVIMPTEEEIAAAKEKGERIVIPRYQYTSQDGSKFFNIHWYHDSNTNNEGYDYFESLEMATLAYSVIPKA